MRIRVRKFAAGLLAGALALSAAGSGPGAPRTAWAAGTSGKAAVYADAENGDDANPGTPDAPVRTLARAQELARGLIEDMTGDVTVYLRGGRYEPEDTLVFDQRDGGKNGFNVIWTSCEGEEAEISGGTRITGWTLQDEAKNIWSAPAQGVLSRDFFVDGERAVRSRAEQLTVLDVNRAYGTIMLDPEGLPESFARPQDLEVTARAAWRSYVIHVDSVTEYEDYPGYPLIQCTEESWNWTGAVADPGNTGIMSLENAYELLDQPGEWYLNPEEDRIYYIPREGQDMAAADAVLGRLEELFRFEGTPEAVVGNITLQGLAFRYTTWREADKPWGLHMDGQPLVVRTENGGRAHSIKDALSAVYGTYLDHMTVEGCRFEHLGDKGIMFLRGIKNTRITGNHMEDLGGGSIYLGDIGGDDYHPSESEEGPVRLTENNDITDNYIKDVCLTYKGLHGAYMGHVARTRFDHNTMINTPYVGVGMGYIAAGEEALTEDESRIECRENSISYNYLENTMYELYDGGAIYITPRYDDSQVVGNYINKSGNNGIYFDMYSYGFTVTENVLVDCSRNFQWDGNHLSIYDNYAKEAPVGDLITERPIDGKLYNRFENNYRWDEAAVEAIRAAAGARTDAAETEAEETAGTEETENAGSEKTDTASGSGAAEETGTIAGTSGSEETGTIAGTAGAEKTGTTAGTSGSEETGTTAGTEAPEETGTAAGSEAPETAAAAGSPETSGTSEPAGEPETAALARAGETGGALAWPVAAAAAVIVLAAAAGILLGRKKKGKTGGTE